MCPELTAVKKCVVIFPPSFPSQLYVWNLTFPGSAGCYILVAELEIEAGSDRKLPSHTP